jgi:glycosyltransferase involved in cell wall biosynthesis
MRTTTSETSSPSSSWPALRSECHRVLYLIDRLYSTTGGAEGIVQKLCRFMPFRGYRCSVATLWLGGGVAQDFSCPVHVFPLPRIYGWSAIKYGRELGGLLRREQFDIVHTFFPASDIWGGIVSRLSGCPILISSRRDMGILRTRRHRIAYSLANRFFDQVQTVSERVREFCLREDNLPPEKVVTVYNGIDLNMVDAALTCDRSKMGELNRTGPVVVTVANLRPVKGIDVLVLAADLVRQRIPHVQFLVVGEAQDTAYAEGLGALVARLGLDETVRFLGRRNDVCAVLKASDVFCLPSRSEGMSNALLEAMACGLPCVATSVGGNSEVIIDGKTGFLVPSCEPEILATQLVRLLLDRELSKGMGQNGRSVVQSRFTVQHMVERLGFLYDQLLLQRDVRATLAGRNSAVPEVLQNRSGGLDEEEN